MSVLSAIKFDKLASGFRALQIQCSNPACRLKTISYDIWGQRTGSILDGEWLCCPECLEQSLAEKLWKLTVALQNSEARPRMPLGLILLSKGFIQEHELRVLTERQAVQGKDFVVIVRESGIVPDEQLTTAIAAQWGQPVLLTGVGRLMPAGLVPPILCREYGVVPVHMLPSSRKTVVGFTTGIDYSVLRAIEHVHECETVPCFITNKSFESALSSERDQQSNLLDCTECGSSAIVQRLVAEVRKNEIENTSMARFGEHIWVRMFARRRHFDAVFRL